MNLDISVTSSFYDIPNELHILNLLFCNGLSIFHLRKDLECRHISGNETYTEDRIRKYIESIPEVFWDRIIIHSHFHLVAEYGLKGAHFKKNYSYQNYLQDNNLDPSEKHFNSIGFSVHSLEEVKTYDRIYNYLFLSPIFDSISNKGYNSKFNLMKLKQFLQNEDLDSKIIALGGMNHTKVAKVKEFGFNGLSLLGYIWSSFEEDGDIVRTIDRFKLIQQLALDS